MAEAARSAGDPRGEGVHHDEGVYFNEEARLDEGVLLDVRDLKTYFPVYGGLF